MDVDTHIKTYKEKRKRKNRSHTPHQESSECVFCCCLVWFGVIWFHLIWFGLIWFGYEESTKQNTGQHYSDTEHPEELQDHDRIQL